MIRLIRQDNLYSGVSMICGSLRARGMKVTREHVGQSLRSIDPIGVALRWPAGATRRRPYSVAGPNSLWHIGIYVQVQYNKLVERTRWGERSGSPLSVQLPKFSQTIISI